MNILLSFQKPKHVIQGFPLDKRKRVKIFDLPIGSQFLSAEDQSHEGILMLWVMVPTKKDLPTEQRTVLVTFEGEEFETSEMDIPELEYPVANVLHIGMWVHRTISDDEILSVTGHVLEVIDSEPV